MSLYPDAPAIEPDPAGIQPWDAAALDGLRAEVAGPVLVPGDPGYEDEVVGFNLAAPHRPSVVVCATSESDVVAAVRFAGEHGLGVGVHATGHGGVSTIDELMISTSRMQGLDLDAEARTVTVGAGVKWRTVLDAVAPYGLTGACGSTSDVSVVGFTLGGGLPVLGRVIGFASDHVRSLRVVTADGIVRQVDADHETDLFWALRGGKGNVGVVTSMTLELLPIAQIHGGGIFFEGQHAAAVLPAFRDATRRAAEHTCLSLGLLRLPPLPDVPEPLRGRFVVHVRVAHHGEPDELDTLLAPLRAAAPAMMDMVGPLPTQQLDRVHNDPESPVPAYERGALLRDLDDATIASLLDLAGPDSGTPILLVEVRQLGGALSRPGAGPDAVGGRDAAFSLYTVGVLAPPVADIMPRAIEGLITAMEPHCTGGTLVNFHGQPRDASDRARCWTSQTYQRLQQVKVERDPANMFRFGHAVPLPA